MRFIKIYSSLILVLVTISNLAQVQGIEATNPRYLKDVEEVSKESEILNSSLFPLILEIEKPTLLQNRTVSGKLYLKLDLGEDLALTEEAITLGELDLTLNLKYRFTDESLWRTKSIRIQDNIPEELKVIDLTTELVDHIGAKIEVSTDVTTASGLVIEKNAGMLDYYTNLVANSLRLTVTFVREYNLDVRLLSNTNQFSPKVVLNPAANSGVGRRFLFSWLSPNHEYPNYEIQLLKVENEDPLNLDITIAKNVKLDWNKALKIETQSYEREIELILAEGTGLYTWRVRPIGTYYEGGIGNSDNYGMWSTHLAQYNEDPNNIIEHSSISATSGNVFFFEDPDDGLNWNYTRVFTEGNQTGEQGVRISEGMTYADGLLRTRQSQQYNSEDKSTILSQTISDYSGRPALTTLPVPVAGRDLNGYEIKLAENPDGDVYTAKDYDVINTDDVSNPIDYTQNPREIKTTGTKFEYYDGTNTDGVASAEGYPYSRTLFKTDGTGRATESSGVGKKHAIGSRSLGKGRTTKVYYASPSDAELIRIFGDEAPLAESVIKTITIDPNDVASVAYTSKEGKTIATALISNYTDNLLGLEGNISDNTFEIENSTDQNVLSSGKFVSTKRIAIPSNGTAITLKYSAFNIPTSCAGECNYKVQFSLIDFSSGKQYQSPIYNVNGTGELDFASQAIWSFENNDFIPAVGGVLTLNEGEYLIVKEVFSANNADLIEGLAMTRANEIEVVLQVIADSMELVNNPKDLEDFKDFLEDPANGLVFPTGFSVVYANGGLVITDNGSSSETGGGCASCGTTTISLPEEEFCVACEGVDGSEGVGTVEYIRANNPNGVDLNTVAWSDLKVIVDNEFMPYLTNKIQEEFGANVVIQDELESIAPGFTTNSLSYMITNMLASKYYTGKSKKVGLIRYRASEDENGSLERINLEGDLESEFTGTFVPVEVDNVTDLEWNYDCEELYKCWKKAVNMINVFDFDSDPVNLMDGYNDSEGADASEDQSDSDDAQEGSGGGSKLLDFIISRKMRKFSDGDGEISPAELESVVSLPNMFLDCAQRQFSAIVDDEIIGTLPSDYSDTPTGMNVLANKDNIISDYDPSDKTAVPVAASSTVGQYAPKLMKSVGVAEVVDAINCDGSILANNTHELLYYRYILKPEWMFKYFVYNSHSDYNGGITSLPDNNHLLVTQRAIELASNYNPDPCTASGSPCFKTNAYYHEDWSAAQRLSFYKQISGGKKSSIECPNNDPDDQKVIDVNDLHLSDANLLDQIELELKDAIATCESKSGEIRSGLLTELEAACYIVEECGATGSGVISEEGVDRMVEAVIEQCKIKVHTVTLKIFSDEGMNTADYNGSSYGQNPYADSPGGTPYVVSIKNGTLNSYAVGFPQHTVTECCYLDDQGGSLFSYKRTVSLFPACDQAILDQVNNWDFVPHIAPLPGCSSAGDAPGWTVTEGYPCGGSEAPCNDTQNCEPISTNKPQVFSKTNKVEASTINP